MLLADWWASLEHKDEPQAGDASVAVVVVVLSLFVPLLVKQITIIILTTISGICASVERNERQNETQLNATQRNATQLGSTLPSSTSGTCQRTHTQQQGQDVAQLGPHSGEGESQLEIFCNLCCHCGCCSCSCSSCCCCCCCCVVEQLVIINCGLWIPTSCLRLPDTHSQPIVNIISDVVKLLPSDFVNLITNQLTQDSLDSSSAINQKSGHR